MLNELSTLHDSLKHFNVHVQEMHPSVKRLARSAGLIVGMNPDGGVGSVEFFSKQQAVQLPKIQESNHSNFPAFNWESPVWKLQLSPQQHADMEGCSRKDVRRRLALLKDQIAGAEIAGRQAGVLGAIQKLARDYQSRFANLPRAEEFVAFHILIDRLCRHELEADKFLRELTDAALRLGDEGSPEIFDTIEALLLGERNKAGEQIKSNVPVFLDLSDCTQYDCRVADPRMAFYFSDCLTLTEAAGAVEGICAVTGKRMALESDKMPSPVLPVLGPTILMSMNPDTHCLTRYGRTGTDIFPVGKKTITELNSTLQHLTSPDRKGKNWQSVPASLKGKSNLLLVYLREEPLLDADLAKAFSESGAADELYTKTCEDVKKALAGRATRGSGLLELFILNKINKGQVQVELSLSFTASQVIEGGKMWQLAALNAPSCVALDHLSVPYPSQVALCLQSLWIRGGQASVDAPGINIQDVYNLLIAERPQAKEFAQTLLGLAVRRSRVLLAAIGHAVHRGESDKQAWKKISPDAKAFYAVLVAIFAITLFKLDHRKEAYMQQPAFQLGRLLSLADTLHLEYCKGVRKEAVPPQLLGNTFVPVMANNPNRGLARLRDRIRIYQGWATTKGSGLAKWSLGEMGKISPDLAQNLPDRRMTEAEQAQFLLGYLARFEKTDKEVVEGAMND
jgi:hypothetical protein